MDWRQCDAYYMRSGFGKGQFYIAKSYVKGTARYSLWQHPTVLHGVYDSAEAAKAAAVGLVATGVADRVMDSGSGDRVGADAGGGTD